jgi:hypothetical protein
MFFSHNYFQTKIKFRDEHKGDKFLGSPLTPKAVFLLNYLLLIALLGPLSLLETNIAEKKNGQIRKLSTRASQTRNVLHTISTRYICTLICT